MTKTLNILICPLEWGMGHAGRMIPVAAKLLSMNHRIFIGSGEEQMAMFRNELTGLSYIHFPGFKPEFSLLLPQYLSMLIKLPVLIYHIIREHFILRRIIREYSIDIVISDNRFGLWNRNIKTVYITHMLRIPFPQLFRRLEPAAVLLHKLIIDKYSFCFVPDLPGEINVSGRLSHDLKKGKNTRYIGLLSRFTPDQHDSASSSDQSLFTVILSGPQPQKGFLKQTLAGIFRKKDVKAVFLEGRPEGPETMNISGKLVFFNHLAAGEMRNIITRGGHIISRSGYTTIMELISLNRSAVLIPTPGQTEQEYLAEYLAGKGWFSMLSQKQLIEDTDFTPGIAAWPPWILETSRELFDGALKELLE